MFPGKGRMFRWTRRSERTVDSLDWVWKESYTKTMNVYRNIKIKEGSKEGEN